jgi:MoxR-like ATPase
VSAARPDLRATQAALRERVVGRQAEMRLLLAALSARRDVLLEGPPGTSKSTLLREVSAAWDIPLVFVEGNAELTTSRLVGHHNPARVLREDFTADTFVPGPLVRAMEEGGFLYVEEINRAPEDTLNALLGAVAERQLAVPRVGVVRAREEFRVIASMNPFDNVGTSRISASVHDRFCRIAIGYQSEDDEAGIVRLRTGAGDHRLVADAVGLVRATRAHHAVRQGSSVRGAIDLVLVAEQLDALAGDSADTGAAEPSGEVDVEAHYRSTVLDAAMVALSGRIQLVETADTTPERVIREIWEDRFFLAPHRAAPG